MTSLMCVCSATHTSSPPRVSNCYRITPATRILKKTAFSEDPNCMMSRSSAAAGTPWASAGKVHAARVHADTMRPGSSPIGSSMRFTKKNVDPPYGS